MNHYDLTNAQIAHLRDKGRYRFHKDGRIEKLDDEGNTRSPNPDDHVRWVQADLDDMASSTLAVVAAEVVTEIATDLGNNSQAGGDFGGGGADSNY